MSELTKARLGFTTIGLVCVALLAFSLSGCATTATPFKDGAVAAPPQGCIDMRRRGGDC
jgi:hypothetical protein